MKKILYNPFEEFSERQLLLFGLLALIIGSLLGTYFKARYDGVIDVHFVENSTYLQTLIDLIVALLCCSLMFFLFGIKFNKKTRWIDLIITVLIAKIPFYFLTLFNFNNAIATVTNKLLKSLTTNLQPEINFNDGILLITSSLMSLLSLVWAIVLLYNGFKVATNAKTIRHIIYFVIALILAEIISKTIIYLIN